jgi:hypothetical protein
MTKSFTLDHSIEINQSGIMSAQTCLPVFVSNSVASRAKGELLGRGMNGTNGGRDETRRLAVVYFAAAELVPVASYTLLF